MTQTSFRTYGDSEKAVPKALKFAPQEGVVVVLELPEDRWSGSGRKSVALPSGLYLPAFRQTSWLSDKNKDKFKRLPVSNTNTN